jgi:hypothetical protein
MRNSSLAVCRRVTYLALLLSATSPVFAQCIPAGGLNQLDANTYNIDIGTSIPATGTLQTCSFPFSLPAPGRIVKLEGTVLFRAACGGDTDAVVSVNGGAKQAYHLKQKLGNGGGVSTVFVSYDIPLAYASASASIEFAAFIPAYCPATPDWEFNGVMRVEKAE